MASRFWLTLVISLGGCGTATDLDTATSDGGPAPAPIPTSSAPAPTETDLDAVEAAVYAALLRQRYPASLYVIVDTTNGTSGFPTSAEVLPGISSDTLTSFQARNESAHPIAADMDLGAPYVLWTQAMQDQIFGGTVDGWGRFYTLYPEASGITELSRVGFNASLSEALAYVGVGCGPLCGQGRIYLLSQVNGAWVVAGEAPLWIS
jgi:hypothetical protein